MAFMVSLECNETIDEILWQMPLSTVIILIELVIDLRNGEISMTRYEKALKQKELEILEKEYTQ